MSAVGVTRLLVEWSEGNAGALERLFPIVYDDLRRHARRYLRAERASHTLQPTALVHEAFLRLIDQRFVTWQNRAQFFALAAQMMRRILVNHAIRKRTAKRGGTVPDVPFDDDVHGLKPREVDLLALDEALTVLARIDPRQSQIVELRYFGGLTVEETADVVGVSPATVKREWTAAKLWLRRQIAGHERPGS